MKRFLRKINSVKDPRERLRLIVMLFFVFSLPYDIFYSTAIIILLTVLTLIDLNRDKFRCIPRQFFLFQVVFFLAAAGYFYSFRKDQASFLLERQLSIFLFPLVLPLAVNITPMRVRLFLSALLLTTLIALTYLFLSIFFTVRLDLKIGMLEAIRSGLFFNHQFTKPIGIHAGYLSLYVATSFFYALYLFNRPYPRLSKFLLLLAMLFMAAGQFFLASRNIIIGSIFILGLVYPLFLLKHKWRHVFIFAAGTVLFFIVISKIPYLNNRFSEDLMTDINLDPTNRQVILGGIEPRIDRWKAGWDLFLRSPVFGYGTGDEVPMLKTEYARRHLYISYLENINAHNQYLSYLIKNGVVGLVIFICTFFYYLRIAWKRSDFLYMSFLTLLMIGFYTENILDANKGIVFFAFFNTVFGYSLLKKERSGRVGAGAEAFEPSVN